MTKLYYGSGVCSIEGTDLRGLQIHYKGAIQITDKTSDNFFIKAGKNIILIVPIGKEDTLHDLFEYKGYFKIISCRASDSNGVGINCTVKKVMDYSELLDTKAEDMTTKSEHLKTGYISKTTIRKTTVDKNIIENLHTSSYPIRLYVNDEVYAGAFHIHSDGSIMSGDTHTGESVTLRIKK